ncbi:MAG: hypothetical protein ACRDZY_00690 [Acidimicrobiales bacterium]
MRALTLTQPWGTLVAIGAKCIETRSWRTGHRGPVAIHAAFGWPQYARDFAERFDVRMIGEEIVGSRVLTWNERLEVDRGHVLATASLVGVERITATTPRVSDQERLLGDYRPGRWAWVLEDVKELEFPVEARGHLGLWTWTPEAAA